MLYTLYDDVRCCTLIILTVIKCKRYKSLIPTCCTHSMQGNFSDGNYNCPFVYNSSYSNHNNRLRFNILLSKSWCTIVWIYISVRKCGFKSSSCLWISQSCCLLTCYKIKLSVEQFIGLTESVLWLFGFA